MVLHIYNPSIQEAYTGEFQVQGQPVLFQTKQKPNQNNKKNRSCPQGSFGLKEEFQTMTSWL
jgi:hypothetical protein